MAAAATGAEGGSSKVPSGAGETCISIPSAGGYDKLLVSQGGEVQCDALLAPQNHDKQGGVDRSRTVTVQIHAAGVNYADVCIRWGLYASAAEYVGYPITPGFEFAGTVLSTSHADSPFHPGQRVFGVTLFGAYSTGVRVPEHQLFAMPDGMTMAQGAAVLATYFTAYYAFHELARPPPGSSVLIHSAAGGVGSTLARLAHAAGCRAVGVVGAPNKAAFAAAAGCAAVITKAAAASTVSDSAQAGAAGKAVAEEGGEGGYRAIFDANGVATLSGSYSALAPAGRLVVYGFHSMLPRQGGVLGLGQWLRMAWDYLCTPRFDPLHMVTANKSVMAFNLSFLFNEVALLDTAMDTFRRLWADGTLAAGLTIAAFPLEDVAAAH
ncbi:VAT1, partial [Symbiodinium sp. KB8]